MTFLELCQHSQRLAYALRERGIGSGDVVITDVAEDLNLVFMEALFHEATIAGVHLGPMESTNRLGVDWLIAHEPSPTFPLERTVVVDEAFFAEVAKVPTTIEPRHYEGYDSIARLLFSSGTTGVPAAIPWTITMAEGRCRLTTKHWSSVRPIMSMIRMTSSIGFIRAYASIADGETYFSPGSVDENVALVRDNFVANLGGSPIQFAQLVEFLRSTGDSLPDVAVIQTGGSPLSAELADALRQVFDARLSYVYGSTEAGTLSVHEDFNGDSSDVGRPFAEYEVQVVDPDGQPLPVGEVGELRYRGAYTPSSYFREPPGGRQLLRDGWFHPGDLARFSGDGRLIIEGRTTEVINAGGVKLNPSMIDAFVQRVEGVRDAAAFSIEAGLGVNGYAVAVVADPDFDVSSLTAPLTAAFEGCAPRYLVRVDAIRRTGTGKVLRAEMANDLRTRLARSR